jgi:predicted ATP-grasp superfamily ATP-dependent carboligase
MSVYEMSGDHGELRAPVLIVAFTDWVDAGGAGSRAARHIGGDGELYATFDGDALFDYRSHRPILDIVDGTPKQFDWPEMTVRRRRYGNRDLLILTGPEPDFHWREFAGGALEVALRAGVVEHVSLGAIPAAVPHTIATPVMMTASSKELLKESDRPTDGLLRVPAAAVSLVEWTLSQSGIPAVGFWAQAPHDLPQYPPAAIALIRRVESHLGISIGVGELQQEAAVQRAQLDEMFSTSDDAREFLEQLEQLAGEQEIPGADEIAAEVEKFLRGQTGDGGPNPLRP